MATNVNGNGVLLFDVSGQTWIHDGTSWHRQAVLGGPVARADAAMALDVGRNRVVLFGGFGSGQYLQDTWEWDGASWAQKSPATSPSRRSQHVMAYDFAGRHIVMFSSHLETNDTWLFDGITWTSAGSLNPPAGRRRAAMASNGLNGVVLCNGYNTWARIADTWVWRAGSWRPQTPLFQPPQEYDHAMVFHASTNTVVMFGGSVSSSCWTWDGTTWSQRGSPISASDPSGALDPRTGNIITFGGATWSPTANPTHFWNGVAWTWRPDAPSPRSRAAAGFDPIAGYTVLHGGGGPLSDTWTWNGQMWGRSTATRALPLAGHSLDWDPASQQLVMFGGQGSGGVGQATYSWSRATQQWNLLTPAASPPSRENHASTTIQSATRNGILVFGGQRGSTTLSDCWLWDGTTWSPISSTNGPGPRLGAAVAFEALGDTVLLFGGNHGTGPSSETWRLNLSTRTWMQMAPARIPAARWTHRMRRDPARGGVLMVGGFNGSATLGESWFWDSAAASWSQLDLPAPPRVWLTLADAPGGALIAFGGDHFDGRNWSVHDAAWIAVARAPAQFQPIGAGCSGPGPQQPILDASQLPFIGCPMTMHLRNLPGSQTAALVQMDLGRLPVPLQLCPGCLWHIPGLATSIVPSLFGTATVSIGVPSVPALVGLTFFAQGAALNPAAACMPGVGPAVTNAAQFVVGAW